MLIILIRISTKSSTLWTSNNFSVCTFTIMPRVGIFFGIQSTNFQRSTKFYICTEGFYMQHENAKNLQYNFLCEKVLIINVVLCVSQHTNWHIKFILPVVVLIWPFLWCFLRIRKRHKNCNSNAYEKSFLKYSHPSPSTFSVAARKSC